MARVRIDVIPARVLLLAGVLIAAMSYWASPASANDLFTLDAAATAPGRLVQDAAGNAYVTWTRKSTSTAPDSPMFCKIPPGGTCTAPKALPIPGAVDATDEVAGVFPVLGPGASVYVVAPRYVKDDVVIWTSLDSGAEFNGGVIAKNGYTSKSEPSDVLLSGTSFLIGANNPGVAFSTQPVGGGSGEHFEFTPASEKSTVGGSSLGFAPPSTLVTAYWSLESPNFKQFYLRYKGTGSSASEANWEGPFELPAGYEGQLSGGAAGLFLVSQEYGPGSASPNELRVRKYAGGGFPGSTLLTTDASVNLFDGGAIAQSSSGHFVSVAWPGTRGGDQARVMRLFTSADGGATFGAEVDIAHVGGGYSIGDNAELSIGDNGAGWLTFIDEKGLHVADLNPVAPALPTPPAKPPTYKGKEKTVAVKAGDFEFTLRLPKSCVQPSQSFFAGVGKRKRHGLSKTLGGKVKFKSVAFFFDAKKLKVKKKKPFRYLIDPGAMAAGSTHTVTTKVIAIVTKKGKAKKVKRTLKGSIKAC